MPENFRHLTEDGAARLLRMLEAYEAGEFARVPRTMPRLRDEVGTPFVKATASTVLNSSSTASVTFNVQKYYASSGVITNSSKTQDAYDFFGTGVLQNEKAGLFRSYDSTETRWYYMREGIRRAVRFKLTTALTTSSPSASATIVADTDQYGPGIANSTSITVFNLATASDYCFKGSTGDFGLAIHDSTTNYRIVKLPEDTVAGTSSMTNWAKAQGNWENFAATTDCPRVLVQKVSGCDGEGSTGGTFYVRLPRAGGMDPNVVLNDVLAYEKAEDGDFVCVSDYLDAAIGTVRMWTKSTGELPSGWVCMDNSANSTTVGTLTKASGISMESFHVRGSCSTANIGNTIGNDTFTVPSTVTGATAQLTSVADHPLVNTSTTTIPISVADHSTIQTSTDDVPLSIADHPLVNTSTTTLSMSIGDHGGTVSSTASLSIAVNDHVKHAHHIEGIITDGVNTTDVGVSHIQTLDDCTSDEQDTACVAQTTLTHTVTGTSFTVTVTPSTHTISNTSHAHTVTVSTHTVSNTSHSHTVTPTTHVISNTSHSHTVTVSTHVVTNPTHTHTVPASSITTIPATKYLMFIERIDNST